jgi:hypothetical protein
MIPTIASDVAKTEAVQRLGKAAGLGDINPWDESVAASLDEVLRRNGPSNPFNFRFAAAAAVGARTEAAFTASSRSLELPVHLTERPEFFPPAGIENAFSPALTTVSLPRGIVWNFAEGPVVMLPDGKTILRDFTSKYSGLVHFYDVDPAVSFRAGTYIDGTVIVMTDDVRPLNFCHWLIDGLPRFAALGPRIRRSDTFVVTLPLTAPFQLDSLLMCGFERRRIIEVKNFQAIQARELIVTSDLANMPHPAFKAAPWAMSYLRGSVGLASAMATRAGHAVTPKKIYISRADAGGRRVTNETEFCNLLIKAGYTKVILSELPLAEQVTIFAGATHVVALHGAGLSNAVFLTPPAQVIEIFPISYGTPAYYVLTAGNGNRYATFVVKDVVSSDRAQLDDFTIDVSDFETQCANLL